MSLKLLSHTYAVLLVVVVAITAAISAMYLDVAPEQTTGLAVVQLRELPSEQAYAFAQRNYAHFAFVLVLLLAGIVSIIAYLVKLKAIAPTEGHLRANRNWRKSKR